jgi:hypothetical protein
VKLAKLSVLLRNGHALQVLIVPDRLKIAADEEEINFVVIPGLQAGNVVIDSVKFAVATALDSNLQEWVSKRMILFQLSYLHTSLQDWKFSCQLWDFFQKWFDH